MLRLFLPTRIVEARAREPVQIPGNRPTNRATIPVNRTAKRPVGDDADGEGI